MKIGVPKETAVNERRVAVTPDVSQRLVKAGLTVLVERGAGEAASFTDEAYRTAGAELAGTAADIFGQSDVLLKVQPPTTAEAGLCREGSALVALFQPSAARDAVARLASRKVTAFSLALLPRITRAQPMDVLSSQATVAGYRAVLMAAMRPAGIFPMLMTAAGTLTPARVLVMGAGVAGPAGDRHGAAPRRRRVGVRRAAGGQGAGREPRRQVRRDGDRRQQAEDHRRVRHPALDEDVLARAAGVHRAAGSRQRRRDHHGGHPRQEGADADHARTVVEGMKPGSVIVDLAAETGGNCELTQPGKTWCARASRSSGR